MHIKKDGTPRYSNRLMSESSPYLLQHAHNPVDWYPWGDEAFELARKNNKPVLLSIGYSTCHWCHVMEEESFEDEEIAQFINENYIAIKVDREERPDVDSIYMTAVQAMTGHGGWPMTVFLTPDRKPYFGGTYFPARDHDRGAHMGFLTILKELKKVFVSDASKISEQAMRLTAAISQILNHDAGSELPDESVLHTASQFYRKRLDLKEGGLVGAPKFPSSLPIRFLLRYGRRFLGRPEHQEVLHAATLTLEKMALGGMFDQVGGGFHRYSTDEEWLVPHFEKMLYDNALLTVTYLEGFQATGRTHFAWIARDILRFVEREMKSPEGAFYTALDADNLSPSGHREEGSFFTWTPEEVDRLLSSEDSQFIKTRLNISSPGNFEGRSIPHIKNPLSELELDKFNLLRKKLYEARSLRSAPVRDEKILTGWNGLMISAFAQAGFALREKEYVHTAINAAEFVLRNMFKNGRLLRVYKDGTAKQDAFLEDYAFFSAACLDLFEATSNPKWLKVAIDLDQVLKKEFEDCDRGGFYMTGINHEKLLAREKPAYDGATASGNSVAVMNLLRLSKWTTNDSFRIRAEKIFQAFSKTLHKNPVALSEMLLAVDYWLGPVKEIVLTSQVGKEEELEPFLKLLGIHFVPNRVVVVFKEGDAELAQLVPTVSQKTPLGGKGTATVCERGVCQLPSTDPDLFLGALLVKHSTEKQQET